jgi:diguanylate cyclase (GGDEF)-like protein
MITPVTSSGPLPEPIPGRAADAPEALALFDSYRRLADVFHDVLSEQSLDALLERIADTLAELIPHDDLAIYAADETTAKLWGVFARGAYADEVIADEPFGFGEGITGWSVANREPVLANRADLDPRVRFVEGTPPDPESLIAVPLIARGSIKGALNIYRVGLREFSQEEFRLAVRFGDAAALALDNAHARASLELLAQTDPLTGLWNHRSFHERLRNEIVLVSTERASSVALLMIDLDDFKRVNDIYGHAVGDQVLAELATQLRGAVRETDDVCRTGGEEFAIIVRSGDLQAARALADRVAQRVADANFYQAGPVTLSIGIAIGPDHAANPRELIACAEVAMMTAKARGKSRTVVFDADESERPVSPSNRAEDVRSIAHLKMLHGVSAKLSRLLEIDEISATIADELRQLIDYHNCRIFLRDGDELSPVAFRGDLTDTTGPVRDVLTIKVGVGITGHVAATGAPFLTGDAANCGIGHHIEGTPRIEESLLAVPLRYGANVVGVLVLSKLGLDQFDTDDLRFLEVLAGHASVAFANARLYEAERREAHGAKALLELSRELSACTELDAVAERVVQGAVRILDVPRASLWLPAGRDGGLECISRWPVDDDPGHAHPGDRLPPQALHLLAGRTDPFVIRSEDHAQTVGPDFNRTLAAMYALAPFPIEGSHGGLALTLSSDETLDRRRLDLLAGIAAQAKLALTNARSFESLERTFLSTVEALANALEAKDEYTSSHARWIRDMAVNVGSELGLDASTLKRVELGALFHDIGKIGIPMEILTKPGPLTAEERAVIETHPELGERILLPIEQLEHVRPIVRACHERFDGDGYPDGLRGDEIPLEARIIFVCDAFHAMTTTRPYREALPIEEARRRLLAGAGSQFDPAIVGVCLRVLRAPEDESAATTR